MQNKPTLWTLPKEMYAEISRWLLNEPSSNIIRLFAGKVIIKDIRNGETYANGLLHSFNDEPAVIQNGKRVWYHHSKIHRDNDLPAIIFANGDQCWCIHGKIHRYNGPAVVCINGELQWYQNDMRHRDNGPAMICANGSRIWYQLNKIHRDNGPAIVYADGRQYWYLNGEEQNVRSYCNIC